MSSCESDPLVRIKLCKVKLGVGKLQLSKVKLSKLLLCKLKLLNVKLVSLLSAKFLDKLSGQDRTKLTDFGKASWQS